MGNIDVFRKIRNEGQFRYVTINEKGEMEIVEEGTEDSVLVDTFSASAVIAVYDRLNDKNREKISKIHPLKLVPLCFSLIERKAGERVTA